MIPAPRDQRGGLTAANRWILAGGVVVAAVILILRVVTVSGQSPLFADTDDAMRMVVVHDFLAGQGWYDLVQHRLNTPYGAEIHWSRLVDLPLALLILGLTPVFGAGADIAAGYVWPLLLLAVLLWVSARLAIRLVGPEGAVPAIILPVLSPAITTEFTPGRIDHHNIVILLTLALAWTSIEALKRPRFAIPAGILAATALAVAIESLPAIVAAILVFGLHWAASPRSPAARLFGLSFAVATALHLALARPPARWLEPACDMLSPVYAGAALVVALAFVLVSLLPVPRSFWLRLLLLAGLGLAGLAGLLALYPQCLGGPYAAIDPWLVHNWLDRISEARPWHRSVADLPAYTVGVGVPVLFGVAVVVLRLLREPDERGEWLALFAFLALAMLVMLMQVRGARLAAMLAVPGAAWLIVALRHRYLGSPRLPAAIALAAAWLVFSSMALIMLINLSIILLPGRAADVLRARADKLTCLLPEAFADLRTMPAQRVMTPIDLGAHLLLETPHAVVAAPYHRNQEGVRDTFDFFNQPIEAGRAILAARGVSLVVTCPAMAEMRGLPDRTPDSFVELAARDELPDWLSDIGAARPLKIYAVLPQ